MLAVSASLAYKKHAQKEDGSGLPHGPRRPPSRGRLTAAHSVERTHRTPPHAYAARRAGALLAGRGARAGAQAARVPGERAARRGAGGQARLQPRRQRAHTAAGRKLAQQAVGVRAGRARDRAVQPRDLRPRRSSFGRVKAPMYSWQTYRPLCRSVRSALSPTRLPGWTRYQAAIGRHRQRLVLRISHPCPTGNLVRLEGKQALVCTVTRLCLLQDGVGRHGSAGSAGGHRRQLKLPRRGQRRVPSHTSIPAVWQ
jgi:hypothetical protein